MKDLSNRITQEQKESIFDFFAQWVSSGSPVKFRDNDTGGCYFDVDDSSYESYLNLFDKSELSSIIVNNTKIDIMILVSASDIKNKNNINIITNFILTNKTNNGLLTDDEFSKITNIVIDKTELRYKKINKIKNNI
jgi:hypothetical protein